MTTTHFVVGETDYIKALDALAAVWSLDAWHSDDAPFVSIRLIVGYGRR
jgi:hypothetical protein